MGERRGSGEVEMGERRGEWGGGDEGEEGESGEVEMEERRGRLGRGGGEHT